jgi:hypothetical protein
LEGGAERRVYWARRVIFAVFVSALMMVAITAPALAFHHVFLPAPECADENSGGKVGGNNPTAAAAIGEYNPAQTPPLPPVDTPGANKGQGDEHCANAESEG